MGGEHRSVRKKSARYAPTNSCRDASAGKDFLTDTIPDLNALDFCIQGLIR